MSLGFIVCDNVIDLFIDGKLYTVDSSHPNYKLIEKEINGQKRLKILKCLVSVKKAMESFMKGKIKVNVAKEEVTYKGTVVEPVITKKIIEFLQLGLNAKPLIKFLDKLMSNPSARAVQELYKFLENNGLCLAPDGDFYSYKSVRKDWYDHYSGKFLNKPGKTISILRNQVSDDCTQTCHFGLHIGTFNYAKNFHIGNCYIILVKTNPKNVVSVPIDGSNKCRVCSYKVIKEYKEEQPIKEAIYLN